MAPVSTPNISNDSVLGDCEPKKTKVASHTHSLSQLSQAGMSWTISKADRFGLGAGGREIKD